MAEVKPNPKKLKRDGSKTSDTGWLDAIWIAFDDFTTTPVPSPLTSGLSYADYDKATGVFNPNVLAINDIPNPGDVQLAPLFQPVTCVKNSIKTSAKPLNNLTESTAVETTLSFTIDSEVEALGFREMFKRAEVHIVLVKPDGRHVWFGRQLSGGQLEDFTDESGIEKSVNEMVFKFSRYKPCYLETPLNPWINAFN
ncbi:hypothetical protein [Emticicia fontis]